MVTRCLRPTFFSGNFGASRVAREHDGSRQEGRLSKAKRENADIVARDYVDRLLSFGTLVRHKFVRSESCIARDTPDSNR
jgi:hypothetical protein